MENLNQSEGYRQYDEYLKQPMSVGEWFVTILITAIPLVGIIMLFVWAFSGNTNVNKANWAKASLIWAIIGIVIAGFILSIMGAALWSAYGNY
nr:hypothetical protein [Bacteroidota bacterium]